TTLRHLPAALALSAAAFILSGCGQPSAQEAPKAAGGPPISAAEVIEKQVVETQEFTTLRHLPAALALSAAAFILSGCGQPSAQEAPKA
ncbi:hypothetical protein CQA15_29260, partial [Klebsiella pneumoniae]|uniref:hypothetical protein n=1 Tax=Klebsiella pneumoniae TaxID=573 RepID=UPI000BDB6FB8